MVEAELARLRAENARLLRLLKMTPQQAAPPTPGQAAFFEALPGLVDDGSPPEVKVAFFGALFAISPAWREQAHAMLGELLSRAQEAGSARADLTAVDLTIALIGVSRTMDITGGSAPGQWRRHLAIVLDGMKACHAQRLPGLPASPEQLDCGLREWSCRALRSS